MPEVVGEYLDRLATIEMRPGRSNLPRGLIHQLYDAARGAGGAPLSYRMAKALWDRVQPHDVVLILTGAGGPPFLPKAEVDGLLGAVAMGRALLSTKAAKVIVLTEERAREPLWAVSAAAGQRMSALDDPEEAFAQLGFEPTPIERDECIAHAKSLIKRFRPAAVIAIEKLSPNRAGFIHGATGINYDSMHTKADVYIDVATGCGAVTCGIGDCGNEIGYGAIADDVRRIVPAGPDCSAHCDCGGGSAAATVTDYLLPAAISNWGGYAIAAELAFLAGDASSLITGEEVDAMLRAAVRAGAFDGGTSRPSLSDDGVPLDAQVAVVTMMRRLVLQALSELDSPGH